MSYLDSLIILRMKYCVCVCNKSDHQRVLPTRLKAFSEFLPTCLMEFNFAAVDLITALNNQNILHSDTLV